MDIFYTAFLSVISLGLFIDSIFLFQGKGPIPSTLYMLAKPKERKKMRTKAEYRFTGSVMLVLSIVFLLLAVNNMFSIAWIGNVIIWICIVLAVYVVFYAIKEAIKL